MSLILVRPEPVKNPYYVETLGVHIASSKELCYVIYQNPLFAMDNFVSDRLIRFIRAELGLVFLGDRLAQWKRSGENPDEMLIIILEECYYYTAREIQAFRARIESYRRMSPVEFTRETGDCYFRLGQYGTAIRCYERILQDWRTRSLPDDFTAVVWNNIGAAYAGIFWFEKAMDAYEMSYNFRKDVDTVKRIYQLTVLNPALAFKERYEAASSQEQRTAWKKEIYDAMEAAEAEQPVTEIRQLFDRDPLKRLEGAGEKLAAWKSAYRKML